MICRNIFLFGPSLATILWLSSPGLVFAQNSTQQIRGTPPPPILPSPLPAPTTLPNPEDLLLPSVPNKSETQDNLSTDQILEKITVEEFRFEGNTAFSQEELAEITQPFTDRQLSFSELLQARSEVTKFYVSKGYITSGAYIPPQTLENGLVIIKIIEGGLEAINVQVEGKLNPDYVRDRLWLAAGKPLNVPRLLEALQILQLNPIISKISSELTNSTEPGQSILNVSVETARSFYPSIILDNGRNPQVGSFRRGVALEDINLSGNGDTLQGTYLNTDGSNDLDVSYAIPLTPENGTLTLGFRNITGKVIEYPFSLLDLKSYYQKYLVSFRQPLWQTPYSEFALGLGFDHQTSSNTLLGYAFPSRGSDIDGNTRLSSLRFSQDWLQRSDTDVLAAHSEFALGINAFNATTPFDAPYNSSAPDSNYFLWRSQAQWVHLLAPDTLLLAKTNIQIADSAVPSLEQFALGGLGSVEGYRQNTLLTDNGAFASLEARFPLYRIPEERAVLQIIPFVNWGTGWNNQSPNPETNTLASIGLGLQWQYGKNITARIDWAKRLGKVPYIEGNSWQDDGIIFSVTITP
jgi:hemolysin activation/secretion protein